MYNNEQAKQIGDYLKQCHYFANLSEATLQSLIAETEFLYLKSHEVLFDFGDLSNDLFVLLEGELISYVIKSTGEKVVVGAIHPGETVGELGVLSGEPRSLSVQAAGSSLLLKIPGDAFKKLCAEQSSVLSELSKLIIERSLKTIKLVTHEKPHYHLTLICPMFNDNSVLELKTMLQEALEHQFPFYEANESHVKDIRQQLKENHLKPIFVYTDHWINAMLNVSPGKATRVYLIFKHTGAIDPKVHEILNYIHMHPNIRLEFIFIHDDNVSRIENTERFLDLAPVHLFHHIRIHHENDIKRLVRFMTGNAVTLVLGGGGAKGMLHISVIKALLDKGIPIDAVAGTSIGACFAACYAIALNFPDAESNVQKFKRASMVAVSLRGITWPLVSLYSACALTDVLMELFRDLRIEDLWIPFFAITTDVGDKKELMHTSGKIYDAVRASISLPGIFPPFVVDGKLLLDGGLINNLPVNRMRELIGPDHLIVAVSLSRADLKSESYNFPPKMAPMHAILARLKFYREYNYPPFFDTLIEALLVGSSATEIKNCQDADLLIRPNLSGFKLLSMGDAIEDQLWKTGYNEAIATINDFLEKHPEFKTQVEKAVEQH